MSKSIKDLAESIKSAKPTGKKGRSNRTLSLAEPEYSIFQKYCKEKGKTASEVVDQLIEIFLSEVEDDLNT